MMRRRRIRSTLSLVWFFLSVPSWSLSGSSSANVKNPECISLVSWNLLAPVYAVHEKYPDTPAHALDWEHRERLIVDKLHEMNADIYCLQEVEVDLWDDLLKKMPGYDGVLQDMKGNHPVAAAILIKKASKLETLRTESRSRALLSVLRTPVTREIFFLANVHLDAGRDSDSTRFFQLRSLLKRIIRHMHLENIPAREGKQHSPVVIAGDMNMLRDTNVYTFLATGSHPSDETTRAFTHKKLLPLHDAHADEGGHTFRQGMVLDYVWTSNAVQVTNKLPLENNDETLDLPSETHPSDHLPIGVELTFIGWDLEEDDRQQVNAESNVIESTH